MKNKLGNYILGKLLLGNLEIRKCELGKMKNELGKKKLKNGGERHITRHKKVYNFFLRYVTKNSIQHFKLEKIN